ncbi:hypothetical protein DXG01_010238 [Tephrocybe rancida]|nr:hypothetical protein DXG01_010238 [Tephrocybe rancida]
MSSSSTDSSSSSSSPSDYLRTTSFSRPEGATTSSEDAVTASDFLMAAYDPAKLHPLADLGDKLDYLLLDDDKKSELPGADTAIPSRGWSDDLCYGTGTMYLSGLALGGAWGVREGARRPLAVSNTRLRINSVLNSVTRRGTFIGNSAGVLALLYNGVNSSIDAMRGKHDTLGSMGAGAVTGALFKSTGTPYGYKPKLPNSFEVCYRCPAFSSKHAVSDGLSTPRRIWAKRSRSPHKFLLQFDVVKLSHHVLFPVPSPLSLRRCTKMNRPVEGLEKHLSTLSTTLNIYVAISDQPSPPSSIASFVFSSGSCSSSSRSPQSSQNSPTATSPHTPHLLRRQPRIQVSSLLADPYARTYHLEIIQQPQKTAEFGHNNLSRLPLTPPIIARLTVRDSSGNSVVPEAELPFLIAHLSLFSGDGLTALDMGSSIGSDPPLLYGNLVSSIDQLEDLQGNMGLFFIFPDVSIRWRGRFQIGVTVMRISRTDSFGGMGVSDHGVVLAETRTRSFDVLPHSQYTAHIY